MCLCNEHARVEVSESEYHFVCLYVCVLLCVCCSRLRVLLPRAKMLFWVILCVCATLKWSVTARCYAGHVVRSKIRAEEEEEEGDEWERKLYIHRETHCFLFCSVCAGEDLWLIIIKTKMEMSSCVLKLVDNMKQCSVFASFCRTKDYKCKFGNDIISSSLYP